MSEALKSTNQADTACETALRLPKASLRLPLVSVMLGLVQIMCSWQRVKGPKWRTTRTTLQLVDGSGNITRLTGWRVGDLILRELPLQGKVQKRIVGPAARENVGSGCCQRKHHHNPAKMAPFFAATDKIVRQNLHPASKDV